MYRKQALIVDFADQGKNPAYSDEASSKGKSWSLVENLSSFDRLLFIDKRLSKILNDYLRELSRDFRDLLYCDRFSESLINNWIAKRL